MFGSPYGSYYGSFLGKSQFFGQPHNAFLNILIKMGVVGLFLYLCFIGWLLRTCLILRKKLDPLGNVSLGICFILIAAAQFYCLAYDIDLMMYLGYGLTIVLINYFKENNPKTKTVLLR
jgi:O-antigen ligase